LSYLKEQAEARTLNWYLTWPDPCHSITMIRSIHNYRGQRNTLEMDENTKKLAEEVGTAINESVQQSATVAAAIERLREAGFEMELTLKLEIGLRPQNANEPGNEGENSLELTEEDLRILRSMKIRIEPEE
jgi:hypothetical protein